MIELVYLVCWSMSPAMDCRLVRIEKDSVQECLQSQKEMSRTSAAWCNTGRKRPTIKDWYLEKKLEDELDASI